MESPLAERFPRLASIPRVPLVAGPTPVEHALGLSRFTGCDVYVKREDRTHREYGGNKTRKLGYLLGDARAKGADTLLTTGALGSHHAVATAVHGKEHGFDVHAFLSPQPMTPHVDENLRCHVAVGSVLHPLRSALLAPPAMALQSRRLRAAGRTPYVIPHGGSSVVGTYGYVEVGLELAKQVDQGLLPEPTVAYVALGSGASVVGLAIGLAAAGLPIPVRAVLVTSRLVGNRLVLGKLTHDTVASLRAIEPRFPTVADVALEQIVIDDAWLSVGYGVVNPEVERVMELATGDGLTLDPTYTAPTVATLMEDVETERHARVLYVHTLSSADLGPLLRRAPTSPEAMRRIAGSAR